MPRWAEGEERKGTVSGRAVQLEYRSMTNQQEYPRFQEILERCSGTKTPTPPILATSPLNAFTHLPAFLSLTGRALNQCD